MYSKYIESFDDTLYVLKPVFDNTVKPFSVLGVKNTFSEPPRFYVQNKSNIPSTPCHVQIHRSLLTGGYFFRRMFFALLAKQSAEQIFAAPILYCIKQNILTHQV